MLNEARDPVTRWKAQNDFFFFFDINLVVPRIKR
jgi:hypothetical protein